MAALAVGGMGDRVVVQPITFPGSMSVGENDLMVRAQPWCDRSTDDPFGRGRELIAYKPFFPVLSMEGKFMAKTFVLLAAAYGIFDGSSM